MPPFQASGNKLPFLTDQQFEDEAQLLLAEYAMKHGSVSGPPVPIDEIVELYLQLELQLVDFCEMFRVDDVHGALWGNQRRVGIDVRLDPDVNPNRIGRYRFTLAHETGHWRLHRKIFMRNANQLHLLSDDQKRPEYICRSSDREPIEIQADKFAAALLMPKEMIKRVWHELHGHMEPLYLTGLQSDRQLVAEAQKLALNRSSPTALEDALLERAAAPMAERFEVSPIAMRFRLQSMGLLMKKKERSLFD
jgi:Zn-dependent peptidase ImmA (M78 family)